MARKTMSQKIAEAIKYVKKNPKETIINLAQHPRNNKVYQMSGGVSSKGENYLLTVKPHKKKLLASLGVLELDAKKIKD